MTRDDNGIVNRAGESAAAVFGRHNHPQAPDLLTTQSSAHAYYAARAWHSPETSGAICEPAQIAYCESWSTVGYLSGKDIHNVCTPPRILIITDLVDVTLLLTNALLAAGHDPAYERVGTPAELSAALDRQARDLVVASHRPPSLSVHEALAVLKEKSIDVPLVAMSDSIDQATALCLLKHGARHAQAREVWVELNQWGQELHLSIRDDGNGFDAAAARQ